MSTNPSSGPASFSSQPAQSEINGWGMAGLIASVLGIFTCGFLHPLSLLISLVGLLKPPRGMAIAGTVISLLGIGFLVLSGYDLVMGILGFKQFMSEEEKRRQTATTISEATTVIENHRDRTGALPDSIEGSKLILQDKDAWGEPLRYETSAGKYIIRSAGPDKKMNTADDVTSEQKLVETEVNIEGGGGFGEGPLIIPEGDATPPPDPFSEKLDLPDDLGKEKSQQPESNE